MNIYDDVNPDFESLGEAWEPWLEDEGPEFEDRLGGCDYCGCPDVRENPDPFGGKPICDPCFTLVIGGEDGDLPWQCGTKQLLQSDAGSVDGSNARHV